MKRFFIVLAILFMASKSSAQVSDGIYSYRRFQDGMRFIYQTAISEGSTLSVSPAIGINMKAVRQEIKVY